MASTYRHGTDAQALLRDLFAEPDLATRLSMLNLLESFLPRSLTTGVAEMRKASSAQDFGASTQKCSRRKALTQSVSSRIDRGIAGGTLQGGRNRRPARSPRI